MYWSEMITLMQDKPIKKQGILLHNYLPVRTVFGEKKSVKWSEFYAASAAGTTLTAVFKIRSSEYAGERVLMWHGSLYSIQRAYETGDKVELTVCDLAQSKEAIP